ncbi:MAG: flagellar filament capping protein FliD [Burkholderiales bacterium]|jgi:flagellar hook-associated protein 2|nr:flagellar filament capping protein FliD [Burkholderiales bacterium]MCA3162562.1 flagellar filament capping protein FliD [Burkholderiales bacterium]MCA3163339.1 flagellar filament capping protein FliD [Burkholderiales bacterium]MCA3166651.1 flagellar filament capping protein FliD [Burkholderiales bacterium]MCA3170159.1 flagellar filament capping protein FliD [Burkholderiales bacterium]
MSGLSVPGIGSGLDINSLVERLMAVERQPLTALATKKGMIESKISALGQIRSSLDALKTAAQRMTTQDKLLTLKTTVADTSIATVSTSNSATPASFSLEVEQLASAQKLSSPEFASASSSLGNAAGSVTIEFGTYSAGIYTLNPDRAAFTVNVEADKMTPEGIRDVINQANKEVSASLVNSGTGVMLVLTNAKTGANQHMRLSVSDPDGNNTDNAGLSQLAYNPAASVGNGKNMSERVAAQDARVKIDGISITSRTNTLDQSIAGLTISLLKTNDDSPTTMTTTRDDSQVKTAVNSFITAYNNLNKLVRDLTKYDATNREAAILNGESTVRNVLSQVRGLLSKQYGSTSLPTLSELGITTQSDGSIRLDATKFDSTFSSKRDAVVALFTQSTGGTEGDGFAGTVEDLITSLTDNNGLLDARTDGLNASLKNLNSKEDQIEARLSQIEQRYRTQFVTLDRNLNSLQSLSAYLQQQLASIPKPYA